MGFNTVKTRIRRLSALLLTITIVTAAPSLSSRADERADTIAAMEEQEAQTKQTISDLEKQTKETKDAIENLEGQKAQTQDHVNSLESQSSALQKTITGYSNQLEDLSEEISVTEAEMAEVSAQIVELDSELQSARAEEEARYTLLKNRMRAVYESGGTSGMLRLLLESGSLEELFTSARYLTAVVQYDFKKIEEYQALQADIETRTALVEEKEAQLDEYQAQLDDNYDALSTLTDTVRGQLSDTRSSITSEKDKLASYEQELKNLDARMKELESQTAAAQAALAKQIAERLELMREDTSGSYAASASELEWLAATIQAEADGESYTGKLAVGSVIMNRVKSSAFPNTIVGVITQNLQFASYRSGKVELIISRGPNSTCIRAAQEVINGARVGDYLFFMTKYYADYYGISEYTMIGNHAFFYRWKVKEAPAPEENTDEVPEGEDSGSADNSSGENSNDGVSGYSDDASNDGGENYSDSAESSPDQDNGSSEGDITENSENGESDNSSGSDDSSEDQNAD